MATKKKTSEMIRHSSILEMDAWNEEKDGAATLAVAKEFNTQLSSMVHAFSNGSRGVNGSSVSGVHGACEDGGDPARASSLTGNYQPLVWSHFIGVETAATAEQNRVPFYRRLSQTHRTRGEGQAGIHAQKLCRAPLIMGEACYGAT